MKVAWYSCGVSSFIAAHLAKNVDWLIYCHIENQHPDSLRFLRDCEEFFGKKIEIMQRLLARNAAAMRSQVILMIL